MATSLHDPSADALVRSSRSVMPQRGLSAERVRDLQDLQGQWNELAGDVPFRSWEWQEAWWRHFSGPADELLTLAVRDPAGRLVGIWPGYLSRAAWHGGVIRWLGAEVGSDYLTLLAVPEFAWQVAEACALWLHGPECPTWDTIELSGVDAEDAVVAQWLSAMRRRGDRVYRRAVRNCWPLRLPASWEGYLGQLSKPGRRRARGLLRKNLDSGRASQRIARTRKDLADGLEWLVLLHQQRQQSLGRPGAFADPRFLPFLQEAGGRLLDRGRLRLVWTEIEGRTAAVECSLLGEKAVFYYQSGLSPELSHERPGWLAVGASLRWAIEQGFEVFDFLRGDDPYKRAWRAQPAPSLLIRVIPARPLPWLRHAAWWARTTWTRRRRELAQRVRAWGRPTAPGARGAEGSASSDADAAEGDHD